MQPNEGINRAHSWRDALSRKHTITHGHFHPGEAALVALKNCIHN